MIHLWKGLNMTENKLIQILEERFENNKTRHPNVNWNDVLEKLTAHSDILQVVQQMEETGGEPDVFLYQEELYYVDFSKETPLHRTNCCYDEKARQARKKFPPLQSAEKLAKKIGIQLLNEAFYRALQETEPLDLKTSSWLETPHAIRTLGGALFGDNRYQHVFIYHNGAESYYSTRGFRGYTAI